MNRDLQYNIDLFNRAENNIQKCIDTMVKEFCEKWNLHWWAGNGTHVFDFADEWFIIDTDGEEYEESGANFPDDFHLIEDIEELQPMIEEYNAIRKEANDAGSETNRHDLDWYLDGTNEYNFGFRYMNGYENPEKKKYQKTK
jgi:hypothetical protein